MAVGASTGRVPVPVPRTTSFLAAIAVFAAVNAPTVLYAEWRQAMGFAATVQTMVYAIYVLGLIPGLLLGGRWLRRLSPRLLMTAAAGVSVLAALGLALASGPALLLVARALQGAALGVVMSASSAALADAVPPRSRSFTALLITLTAILGASLGPVFAGILTDLSGGTAAAMVGAAVAVAAAAVLLAVRGRSPAGPVEVPPVATAEGATPAGSEPPASSGSALPSVPPVPSEPTFVPRSHLMISLTAAISWSMVGVYQSVGPGLIGAALGVDSLAALGGIVAVVLGVAGLVQVASRGVPVVRGRRLGLSFLVLGIGGFAAMLVTGQLWWAILAAVGAGVGHGFTYLSATQEIGELNRRQPLHAARFMSRYFTIAYACLAVFAVSLGVVGDLWALVPAALVLLAVLAVAAVAMLFSRNRQESAGDPAAS
jgi:MFS family permease